MRLPAIIARIAALAAVLVFSVAGLSACGSGNSALAAKCDSAYQSLQSEYKKLKAITQLAGNDPSSMPERVLPEQCDPAQSVDQLNGLISEYERATDLYKSEIPNIKKLADLSKAARAKAAATKQ